jgi:phage terminase large subunit-like protein
LIRKYIRAEPISALYARGIVDHCGQFEALEDQMCSYTPDFDRGHGSPDRLDAHVWAMTELFPSMVSDRQPLKGPKLRAPGNLGAQGWMAR